MDFSEWYSKQIIDDFYERTSLFDYYTKQYRYSPDVSALPIDGKIISAHSKRIVEPEQKALSNGGD